MTRIAIAAGLSLLAFAGPAGAEAPQCPAEISSRQELASSHPGWRDHRSNSASAHRLSQLTLYDGPPSEQASLAPTRTARVKGWEVSTWSFGSASARRIWLECSYAGTSISLTRELPAETRSCSVTYDPKTRLSGLPRIEKLECN